MGGLPQSSFLFNRSNDAIALISLSLVRAALSDRQRLPILLSRSLALTHLNGQTDNTCNTCVPPFSKHTCLLLLLKRSQRRRTNNKKKKEREGSPFLLPINTYCLLRLLKAPRGKRTLVLSNIFPSLPTVDRGKKGGAHIGEKISFPPPSLLLFPFLLALL